MFGRSLRHSVAATPPSAIGISTDSPLRLSVIVMLSGTGAVLLLFGLRPPTYLRRGATRTFGRPWPGHPGAAPPDRPALSPPAGGAPRPARSPPRDRAPPHARRGP